MNYRLLIVGFILLANPEITIIDLLPDVLGFLLIAKALSPLSPLSPSAESAIQNFRKLSLVSAIKLVAIIPMMVLYATEREITLIFTAGFAILSALYLFPAVSDFFSTFSYLADRENIRIRGTKLVKGFTLVTFLLRYFLAMIPESVYLYVDEYESNAINTPIYPLAAYRTGITVLSFTISLIIGLIWLAVVLRYMHGLRRNTSLNQEICRAIALVEHSRNQAIRSAVKPVWLLFSLSFVTLIGYTLDGMPLFPSFLFPLLLWIAIHNLRKVIPLTKRYTILPAITTILGVISFVAVWLFCELHHEKASVGFFLVKQQFALPVITESITTLFIILCLNFCVAPALTRLIEEHSGSFWEAHFVSHNAAVAKKQKNQLFYTKLVVFLSSLYTVFNSLSFALHYTYPILRLISAAAGAAISIFAWRMLSSVHQAIQEKYAENPENTRNA